MSRRPGKEKEENEEEAMTTIQTTKSGATDLSLSVAETNNLRKKLGLAPLSMDSDPKDDEDDDADGLKAAEKILKEREEKKLLELKRTEELREKLNERKAKKLREEDQQRARKLYEGEGEGTEEEGESVGGKIENDEEEVEAKREECRRYNSQQIRGGRRGAHVR